MNLRLRAFAVTALLIGLAACATVEPAPKSGPGSLAAQLGIEPSSVVHQQAARFGSFAPGERFAPFQLGMYAQTKTEVILSAYSRQSKSYQRVLAIPISRIDHVAMESWGMFDHLKQMQVTAGSATIAINFNPSGDAIAGSLEDTKPAYEALLAAGVKPASGRGRLLPNETKDFIVPIITPAR